MAWPLARRLSYTRHVGQADLRRSSSGRAPWLVSWLRASHITMPKCKRARKHGLSRGSSLRLKFAFGCSAVAPAPARGYHSTATCYPSKTTRRPRQQTAAPTGKGSKGLGGGKGDGKQLQLTRGRSRGGRPHRREERVLRHLDACCLLLNGGLEFRVLAPCLPAGPNFCLPRVRVLLCSRRMRLIIKWRFPTLSSVLMFVSSSQL
jgi:hypothetical protein